MTFHDYQSTTDRVNHIERKMRAENGPRVRPVIYWTLIAVLWAFALSRVFVA
jgi:hypothetical protein